MGKIIKAALCDDEIALLPYIESSIVRVFKNYHLEIEVVSFSNGRDLWQEVQDGKEYDIYFLDIDLPVQNGIVIAEEIRKRFPETVIVFVSGHEELVFQTFSVSPAAFIRKGNFEEDLETAVKDLRQRYFQPEMHLFQVKDAMEHEWTLDLNKVLYLVAMDKYVSIVTADGSRQMIRQTLSRLEEALQGQGFIRTHKSYLVNSRCIYKLENRQVILENGEEIPVSRYRAEEVKTLFFQSI